MTCELHKIDDLNYVAVFFALSVFWRCSATLRAGNEAIGLAVTGKLCDALRTTKPSGCLAAGKLLVLRADCTTLSPLLFSMLKHPAPAAKLVRFRAMTLLAKRSLAKRAALMREP